MSDSPSALVERLCPTSGKPQPSSAEIPALQQSLLAAVDGDSPAHFRLATDLFLALNKDRDLTHLPIAALGQSIAGNFYRTHLFSRDPSAKSLWSAIHKFEDGIRDRVDDCIETTPAKDIPDLPEPVLLCDLALLLGTGWGYKACAFLVQQPDAPRQAWRRLLLHGRRLLLHDGNGGWKADRKRISLSQRWLAQADQLLQTIVHQVFADQMVRWLESLSPGEDAGEWRAGRYLPGLLQACRLVRDRGLAGALSRFAERCFSQTSLEDIGHPALEALAYMPDDSGLAYLVGARLKKRAGQGKRTRTLEKLAQERGTTVESLTEAAVPDHGLDTAGERALVLNGTSVVLSLSSPRGASLAFRSPQGALLKSIPKAVKQDHGDTLKSLQSEVKDIAALLIGQAERLEASYRTGRAWPLSTWRTRFLASPLLAHLARRLIWTLETAEGSTSVMPEGDRLIDHKGRSHEAGSGTLRLWHPLSAGDAEEVAAWRAFIVERGLVQPIRQAHRETYRLTDAELRTGTYSNRFAGHYLRQHQMTRLCHGRGWRYNIQGDWDGSNAPTLPLSELGLEAAFTVDPLPDEDRHGMGVGAALVATDRIRFSRDGAWVPLTEVPPVVYSEVLRDIDLFVSVTSIGADPEWRDRGPNEAQLYWRSYVTAPLDEGALQRRDLLATLLPRLALAGVCTLEDRWLSVQGRLARYRIHLRSGQVEVTENGRHLCIVPTAPAKERRDIYLPFDGDHMLSLIISKAFLLARDDEISDSGIREQIRNILA